MTNDDGVGAPGIDAVVETLRHVSGIDVTVVAPATNQSGTGDRFTTTSALTVTKTTTMHGYPAFAVNGSSYVLGRAGEVYHWNVYGKLTTQGPPSAQIAGFASGSRAAMIGTD